MYTSWGIMPWIRPNACQANGHFINDSCKASRPANREWKRAGMHVRTIYLQSTYTCGIQGFKHYMEIIAFKGKTGVFFIFINRTAAPEYRCQLENLTNYKLQSLKFTDRLIRARKILITITDCLTFYAFACDRIWSYITLFLSGFMKFFIT